MARPQQSLSWIFLHTSAIFIIILNLLTGFRFAILTKPDLLWFNAILPQGNLHQWHFIGGCALTIIVIAYLTLQMSEQAKSKQQQTAAKPAKPPSAPRFSFTFHKALTWYVYVITISAIVTGWLIFYDQQHLIPVDDLHFIVAIGFISYLLLHGGSYFIEYGMAAIKRIALPGPLTSLQLLFIAGILVLTFIGWRAWLYQPMIPLQVKQIPINHFIQIDGHANEAAWQDAPSVTVLTHGGANFDKGKTPVMIRAMQNGVEAYFHITWQDATRSIKHLPLVKTQQGWKIRQNGFHQFDEQTFYEDKFAVMLSQQCGSAADGSIHLGTKPISSKPSNWHGKGYHYTEDNSIKDLWHWKAVRTNDMLLADDNFFGPPATTATGQRRYTAGYVADGKESGAYVMNWLWYKQDIITPKRIPKDPKYIAEYQIENAIPKTLPWVISWFDYEPYQLEKDHYPLGTIMPSVMYRSNRFEGDRADVRARGEWKNGVWSLELSRRLDTKSKNDVAIEDGTCLWVSAFDQSQIAHTRHHQAIKLTISESP
ncbi:MAG: ethylbenzene dehydrogenase-related protein [Pseudomonadales bacterium]|nr:ethylbenzene dehydrogenase-related protein [Pseudomonadales bacterium]